MLEPSFMGTTKNSVVFVTLPKSLPARGKFAFACDELYVEIVLKYIRTTTKNLLPDICENPW